MFIHASMIHNVSRHILMPGLLRAVHSRNPSAIRISRSICSTVILISGRVVKSYEGQFRVIRKNASARHCFCSCMAARHIDFQKYVHSCKHDSQCFPTHTDARIAPCCALPQSVRYSDIAEHTLHCYPHIGAGRKVI